MQVATQNAGKGDLEEWIRLLRAKYRGEGTITKDDFDRILGESQALVDYPAVLFAEDLVQLYPHAKVVMVNRDPEAWWSSLSETISKLLKPSFLQAVVGTYVYVFNPEARSFFKLVGEISHAEGHFQTTADKDRAITFYKNNYERVRELVPEPRRLEWSVKDGWEPLCKHLGLPVPMVVDAKTGESSVAPFPRVNDRSSFQQNAVDSMSDMLARSHAGFFELIGRTSTVAALAYAGYFAWTWHFKTR